MLDGGILAGYACAVRPKRHIRYWGDRGAERVAVFENRQSGVIDSDGSDRGEWRGTERSSQHNALRSSGRVLNIGKWGRIRCTKSTAYHYPSIEQLQQCDVSIGAHC